MTDKPNDITVFAETNFRSQRRKFGLRRDDRLRLLFTCCHPALSLESQVALTLRMVAGLTTREIARALLSAEPAIPRFS